MLEMIGSICSKIFELSLFHIAVAGGCIYGFVVFIISLTNSSSGKDVLAGLLMWLGITLFVAVAAFIILFIVMGFLVMLLGGIGVGFGLIL